MATLGDMTVRLRVDMTELDVALATLQSQLDIHKKCAVASCTNPWQERNRIQARFGEALILFYVCDEHYDLLNGSEMR